MVISKSEMVYRQHLKLISHSNDKVMILTHSCANLLVEPELHRQMELIDVKHS